MNGQVLHCSPAHEIKKELCWNAGKSQHLAGLGPAYAPVVELVDTVVSEAAGK